MTKQELEIKFRVWDKKNKIMHYQERIELFDDMIGFRFKHFETDNIDCLVIMQYTCLKDKNSKEIYEGDIVRTSDDRVLAVEWCNERGGWFPFASGDGCGCCEYDTYSPYNCEVIGNIHENPELLTV
ncbi:MAG TPA: hypothetical protein GXX46_01985 [Peptococcaceae bacterium]|nr:hypothetical protein [Peptococcaceae bacterium]